MNAIQSASRRLLALLASFILVGPCQAATRLRRLVQAWRLGAHRVIALYGVDVFASTPN